MGRIKRGRQHKCSGPGCGVVMRGRFRLCCAPRLRRSMNYCLYYRRAISPVKCFKNVRMKNLRRIEPKENDDGELEDTKDEEGADTEAPVSKFAGNKKVKAKKDGSNNALGASSFGLLGGGDDEDSEDSGITKRMLIMKEEVGHPQESKEA